MLGQYRQFLQSVLIFVTAVALGLIAAWMIIKLHKPDKPVGPLEHVVPAPR